MAARPSRQPVINLLVVRPLDCSELINPPKDAVMIPYPTGEPGSDAGGR
jgi:hypothetical protein